VSLQMEGMDNAVRQCKEVAVHSLILNQHVPGLQEGIHLHPVGGFVTKHLGPYAHLCASGPVFLMFQPDRGPHI